MTPAAQAVLDAVREDRLTPEIQRAYRAECVAAKEESMGETDSINYVPDTKEERAAWDRMLGSTWPDIEAGAEAVRKRDRCVRAHARARIVAFVRKRASLFDDGSVPLREHHECDTDIRMALCDLADAIEAGEHEVQP